MPGAASNTVYGIICDAMVDAGLLGEGDDPNSEQLASNMRRLCDIVNLWQTQGIKLFLQEELTVDMVAGQGTYTITPPSATITPPTKHLRILQGRVSDANGVTRPIREISWQEWNVLSHTNQGSVSGYKVEKLTNQLNVRLWNIPDSTEAANSLIFLVHKQITNPINLLENMAFPQEWRIALRWGLADDIATGQPQAIMDRCAERAQLYKSQLEDWDVEDASTSFAVAFPPGYDGGSFR